MTSATTVLLWALCAAASGQTVGMPSATQARDRSHPLLLLPGWVHLGEIHIDMWAGAYHDSVSGAFVRYRLVHGDDPGVETTSGDIVEEGTLGKRRFRVWRGPDAFARDLREYQRIRAEIGESEDAPVPEEIAERFPPKGTRAFVVAYGSTVTSGHGKSSTKAPAYWVFEAGVAGPVQQARLDGLLIRRDPFARNKLPCQSDEFTFVPIDRLNAVPLGTSFERVLETLGPPNVATQVGSGFAIEYFVKENAPGQEWVRLTFGQDQRLTEHQLH